MAKLLMIFLLCCLSAIARYGHGKPLPPRVSLTKQTSASGSQPDQNAEIRTLSQETDEPPTSMDDCSEFCTQSYPEHTYPVVSKQNLDVDVV